MRNKLYHHAVFHRKLSIVTAFLFFSSAAFTQNINKQFTQGQIYFKYRDNIQPNLVVNADRKVSVNQLAAVFLDSLKQTYNIVGLWRPFDLNNDAKLLQTFRLDIDTASDVEEIMAALKQNPDLEYVERVPIDRIEYLPNDTLYNLQSPVSNMNWQLDRIQAAQAWDITRGSPDIKVAIVDNAIWADHPDLKNKIVLQRDVINNINNSNPQPTAGSDLEWSHGTHCAGLSAGESDNRTGIASIGFNTKIIAVKASHNNDPNTITEGYAGVQWAAANGADIISMSWGGGGYSATSQNIMNTVYNMGIVLVGAAGNDNVSTTHYPSAYNHVISVAATNEDDTKTDFSDYGTTIDVCAPGGYGNTGPSGVLSTTYSSSIFGKYDIFSGTSMACPMVSGLCGLILSINPKLSPDQVEAILKSTADTIEYLNPHYIGKLGAGRINAYKAVSNTPFPPIANFTSPLTTILPGTSINFKDLTLGIPSAWTWTFAGGNPSSSTLKNPAGITYNTEGVYLVKLVSNNPFGTNTITRTGYITVTSTPKPVVEFSASNTLACIGESILFSDSTNYDPASWEWSFNPSSVVYNEGTTSASQNPVVTFAAPGIYTVSLNATNVNGSTLKIKNNYIQISGSNVPLNESFEVGASAVLVLADTIKSKVSVDARSANASLYGLHFQGNSVPSGWSGGGTSTTREQAWNENKAFHSEASICGVNGLGIQGLLMQLDLKQTYSLGPKQCWFRVLVNGKQISDYNGISDFHPTTATADTFATKTFDLSPYIGSVFSVTLQACTHIADKMYGEGDNVFADNIIITNTIGVPHILFAEGFGVYPNPTTGIIQMQLPSFKTSAGVSIVSARGQTIYRASISQKDNAQLQADLSSAPKGIYMIILRSADQFLTRKLILH